MPGTVLGDMDGNAKCHSRRGIPVIAMVIFQVGKGQNVSLTDAGLRCGCVAVSDEALAVSLRLHNSLPPGCLRIYEVQEHESSRLLGGEVSVVVWFSDLSQICEISIV